MIRRLICALAALAVFCSGAAQARIHEDHTSGASPANGAACGKAEGACGPGASALAEGMVRLHVLAGGDSPAEQRLKLELRDVCLRCAEACLWGAEDADEAFSLLQRHLDDFESACRLRARELGFAGEISAEAGVFAFPDRIYGRLTVPAGDYRALRITIGSGEGHNWWCILYPSICTINETHAFRRGAELLESVLGWLRGASGGV